MSTGPAARLKKLDEDVNCECTVSQRSSPRASAHLHVGLGGLGCAVNARRAHPGVNLAIDTNVARPPSPESTFHMYSDGEAAHPSVVPPVQYCAHRSLRAEPAPWGSHAERYGERTASGTDGGEKGVDVQEAALAKEAPRTRRDESWRHMRMGRDERKVKQLRNGTRGAQRGRVDPQVLILGIFGGAADAPAAPKPDVAAITIHRRQGHPNTQRRQARSVSARRK